MRELQFVVEEKRGPIQGLMLWVARIAVAAAFLLIGASKFTSDPKGEWFKVFEQIGWGQWFRYFTGALQVAGAVFLLTPWTVTAGAAMLACTMAGAIVVHIFV